MERARIRGGCGLMMGGLVAAWALFAAASPAWGGAKSEYDTFNLRIEFVAGMARYDEAKTRQWIAEQVALAESLYNTKPALRIRWTVRRQEKAGGRTLANMEFDKATEFKKFMDDHFDNVVGDSRTEGYMRILLVDSIKVKDQSLAGMAWFPHWVTPFSRKFGPIVDFQSITTFPHELGHVLSLKHTFEPYTSPFREDCNKDYPQGEDGKGKTVRRDGSINVMDYNRGSRKVYLNDCQKERAAEQRRDYMAADGKTNYRKLKGLQ